MHFVEAMMAKSYEEINAKIKAGQAVVLTAEEVSAMAAEASPAEIAKKVDVVTTATFGAMCSSGCFINFGHPSPPIRMESITLNGVPVFGGVAAVDGYIGATEVSPERPSYGGAHLLEALVRGEELLLKAHGKGTDCYPRRDIETWVSKKSLNEITMVNPRNAYQNYGAATNSTERVLHTYMGSLLPRRGNVNYSTSGELSPLLNDPYLRTIGVGTRVFLAGAQGFVSWRGTQFNTQKPRAANGVPESNAATLMVTGDLKEMSANYLRAAYFERYGVTLYLGIGIPIPVLDEDMARFVSVRNRDIPVLVCDYGVDGHPVLGRTNYEELRSGKVQVGGKAVKTAPLSSLAKAREIAAILKAQVASGAFPIEAPVQALPANSSVSGLAIRERSK
jgi:L-aspartate semialdehyde sulfurtransferase